MVKWHTNHPEKRVAYVHKWYVGNAKEHIAKTTTWRKEHPDKVAASARRMAYLRLYGITPDEYDVALARQDGTCAICRQTCASGRRLAVDHDHKDNHVRGLLCMHCNRGIGQFGDDATLVEQAALYLRTH